MAIYRFEAKPIKRSAGRNALAVAAYRAGEHLRDAKTGLAFDYERRSGVVHTEILTPENAPDWAKDRQSLWQAVEHAEKRKDAQLAREIVLALPHELKPEERVALVQEFAREQFVSRGMVADISLHAPDRKGDERNYHAHILLTMRELGPDGFGQKVREWNDKDLLQGWREAWADRVNQTLERGGHATRVDHRSLEAQGIDREPEPKVGPIATEIERDGRTSRAGDERRAVWERNTERERLTESAQVLDIELERQRRAATLFDRADYVSTTQDANRLIEKHRREREDHHHDRHEEERQHDEARQRDDNQHRHADHRHGDDADASKSTDEKRDTLQKGEMSDAKQTAFERLMRNLEQSSPPGETERPKESGRDHSGGRSRGR